MREWVLDGLCDMDPKLLRRPSAERQNVPLGDRRLSEPVRVGLGGSDGAR
jgi:hypothetical protein